MSYDRIEKLSRLCELLEKVLAGQEFVEIKVGTKELGGANLRIKGNTVYTNIQDIPVTSWVIPEAWMAKAQKLYDLLKSELQAETQVATA